jgi:hypothetical protein
MRWVFVIAYVSLSSLALASAPDARREFGGRDFLIVQAALPTVKEKAYQIELERYKIIVGDAILEPCCYAVTFAPIGSHSLVFGTLDDEPTLEVFVSKRDLKVVKSWWVR